MVKKFIVQMPLISGKVYPAYVTKKGLISYKKKKVVDAKDFLGWKY